MSYEESLEKVKRLWGEQAGTWTLDGGAHWLEHPSSPWQKCNSLTQQECPIESQS